MSDTRLYVCTVSNHPYLKRNHFYELDKGYVQEIAMRQEGHGLQENGYVGLMFPWKDVYDGLIEVRQQGFSR